MVSLERSFLHRPMRDVLSSHVEINDGTRGKRHKKVPVKTIIKFSGNINEPHAFLIRNFCTHWSAPFNSWRADDRAL